MKRDELSEHLHRYTAPNDPRAVWELLQTLAVYAGALAALPWAFASFRATSGLPAAAWLGASLASGLALSGAQVRAFLVHHDLAHGSLFSSPRWNRFIAPLWGTLASTSPSVWQREHNRHHRDSNNLDRAQDGQTASWTTGQYHAAPKWQRWAYWLVNQRPVLFVLIPPLYFLGFMRVRARWFENLAFAAFIALLASTGRLGAFTVALLPASVFGFFAFHAQHTFEGVVRRREADCDFVENGLKGSSFLQTPRWPFIGRFLSWSLYSVEYHHVHHLSPGIPAWRLRACHDEGARFFVVTPRVTYAQALRATRYTLYDEASCRLVTFAGRAPWRTSFGPPIVTSARP